jgi:hypothetical protein
MVLPTIAADREWMPLDALRISKIAAPLPLLLIRPGETPLTVSRTAKPARGKLPGFGRLWFCRASVPKKHFKPVSRLRTKLAAARYSLCPATATVR